MSRDTKIWPRFLSGIGGKKVHNPLSFRPNNTFSDQMAVDLDHRHDFLIAGGDKGLLEGRDLRHRG